MVSHFKPASTLGGRQGEDVVEEASLRRAAAAAGMAPADVDVCVGLVDDAAVKKRLKDTTDEAIEHGVSSLT